MQNCKALFNIGQIIHHRLFGYRGVIVDIDLFFQGSEEWYESMAPSHPPKDRPWYHVLVDGTDVMTYVAERNIELESNSEPIQHPQLEYFFASYQSGKYLPRRRKN